MKARYQTLENLNQAWWSTFSQSRKRFWPRSQWHSPPYSLEICQPSTAGCEE
ncbi:hypothetical protein [Klebsiella pneumoniae]|uniref:hypothetical protein n=1 Tax=Klebsiella pneumoniae TaxID=573 RepID=UPI0035C72530